MCRSGGSALLCVALALFAATSTASERIETRYRGPTMGTVWTVVLPVEEELKEANRMQTLIQADLDALSLLMSTWDKTSELSAFNDDRSDRFIALSRETGLVLEAALEVTAASGGAYDVALGEVFALYGVGGDAEPHAGESAVPYKLIDDALARARSRPMERQGDAWRKPHPEARIDLSSIAKGFAVDRIGELLESQGYPHYLVEIGGEVRTRGRAGDEQPWAVGIELPDESAPEGLLLEDAHVASSGSYRDWREIDGVRIPHIIDGRDARPVTHDLVSVTVIADSTLRADAWATALLVVGRDEAQALAAQQQLDVQLVSNTDEGYSIWRSAGFAALLAP
jgi:thiamine biosynthesis lipoprotein